LSFCIPIHVIVDFKCWYVYLKETYNKYLYALNFIELDMNPFSFHSRYAVIATECAGCPKIKCERPGCNTNFCYHCKQFWHPNKTCDAARTERNHFIMDRILDMRNGSITYSHESDSQSMGFLLTL